jgi:AraC family transcriptional regulator
MTDINRNTLFTSELYTIVDFTCYTSAKHVFQSAYTPVFCINIPRKGYFTFHTFRQVQEEFTGRILIEKPGCEFKLKQQQPGAGGCTIIRFTDHAYEEIREKYKLKDVGFFSSNNLFSHILTSTAEADYYHKAILDNLSLPNPDKLQIDTLVVELADTVMQALTGKKTNLQITESNKRNHLRTIERAKEFMLENYSTDISLHQLAQHCYVSPFHFCRLFKQFSTYSPFRYLQELRLKHAETLLRTTGLPVTDICFRCGFSRLDYFSAVFTKRYGVAPSRYKLQGVS